ncbi:MAG: hypothetical protein ABR585_07685 [Gemmatimonadaceae bacterium]
MTGVTRRGRGHEAHAEGFLDDRKFVNRDLASPNASLRVVPPRLDVGQRAEGEMRCPVPSTSDGQFFAGDVEPFTVGADAVGDHVAQRAQFRWLGGGLLL